MNSTLNSNNTNIPEYIFGNIWLRRFTFIGLTILTILSIACSCFVLFLLVQNREIRNYLKNHTILCIFLVNFLQATCDLPLTLSLLYHGEVPMKSESFCKFWFCETHSFCICSLQLNAFLSIERYLLIFHTRTLHRYKIILHYMPLIVLICYPIPYSISFAMFYWHNEQLDYNTIGCGTISYIFQSIAGIVNWAILMLGPLLIIIIANVFLIIKVYRHKYEMLQKHVWKKKYRMLRQLVLVSGLQCVVWLPATFTFAIDVLSVNETIFPSRLKLFLFGFIYFGVLFYPLVLMITVPELEKLVIQLIKRHYGILSNRIHPIIATSHTFESAM